MTRMHEEHVQTVMSEEVQRIPTWFVKLVTGAIALATPWAVFVTYTSLANQFTAQATQAEVSGIKGDISAMESASGASTSQVIELRAEVRYLTSAMSKYEDDAEARAELRIAIRRLEDDVKNIGDTVKTLEKRDAK